MKDKAIIFGMGNCYMKYRMQLEEMFDVIGLTSNYVQEAESYTDYIYLDRIRECEYDYIIICSNDAEVRIINQLIDELHIIPGKIKLANEIFEWGRTLFHSQINEDAVIMLLLKLLGKQINKTFYLDLGANHPAYGNNTYGIYQHGGRGILVEPNKELKNLISVVRPEDCLISKAVSLDGKNALFYSLNASALGTLRYDLIDDEHKLSMEEFQIKENYQVETLTIHDLFAMHTAAPDVLSIDIEGMDYDILQQIDYEKHRPGIIVVEVAAMGVKEQKGAQIDKLMLDKGYICFYNNQLNGIYVDACYKKMIEDYII